MEKIYEQAKDLHVVGIYVYANEDGTAYADAECTVAITVPELKDAFIKGAVILVSGDKMVKATEFNVDTIKFGEVSLKGVAVEEEAE